MTKPAKKRRKKATPKKAADTMAKTFKTMSKTRAKKIVAKQQRDSKRTAREI